MSAAVLSGLSDQAMALGPGALPPPPAEDYAAKLLECVRRVRIPLMWVANEEDEHAPLPRVRSLFEELSARDKRLRLLPGRHSQMTVAEVEAQEAWLLAAISNHERSAIAAA